MQFARRGKEHGDAPGARDLMTLAWQWHTPFLMIFHCLGFSHMVTPNSKENWEMMPRWGPRKERGTRI